MGAAKCAKGLMRFGCWAIIWLGLAVGLLSFAPTLEGVSLNVYKRTNDLMLEWPLSPGGHLWSLQSATNVHGPYFDLFPASSPYTLGFSGERSFYRLRGGKPWGATNVGLTTVPGGAVSSNGIWTLWGEGTDIWGVGDAFEYAFQEWVGEGSIEARVLRVQNTHPWAKAGVMIRAGLDAQAPNYATVVSAASGTQSQWRGSSGAESFNYWAGELPYPYWVRVARRGNEFLGCVSEDGTNWRMLSSQSIEMADSVYCGLAVSSHNSNMVNTAVLDNVQVSAESAPLPWGNAEVGEVYGVGMSVYSNGTFTIQSFGYDCWSSADQFQCIHQKVSGDASVTIHIAALENGDGWAKAGVMFREDLGSGSPYSGTILSSGHGTVLQRRYLANNGTIQVAGPNLQAPCWLGVVRRGDVFFNYVSKNGIDWTLVGNADAVTMGTTVQAVVFVTTHNTSPFASETAVLDYAAVTQP